MAFGTTELVIIGILAIFLFGAKRIPELARKLGVGMGELMGVWSGGVWPSAGEAGMESGGVT